MSTGGQFGDIPVEDDTAEPAMLGASATIEARDVARKKRQRVKRQRNRVEALADGRIEYVYEPSVAVMPPLRSYFAALWDRRAFGVELARSEIRGKRSSTMLGSLWALLDPLFMASIYFFLFSVITSGGRTTEFIPTIVTGIMLFQITGGAFSSGGNSVRKGKNLMLNSVFPRALLPLSAIYGLVLSFLPSIPIICGALLLFNDWDPGLAFSLHQLWFVPVFLVIVALAVGFALAISTLVVFVTDASNLMNYISRLFFFSTPIIYPYARVTDTALFDYVRWQPFFGVYVNVQRLVAGSRPDFGLMLTSLAWAIGMLVFGFWVFLRYERQFASKI